MKTKQYTCSILLLALAFMEYAQGNDSFSTMDEFINKSSKRYMAASSSSKASTSSSSKASTSSSSSSSSSSTSSTTTYNITKTTLSSPYKTDCYTCYSYYSNSKYCNSDNSYGYCCPSTDNSTNCTASTASKI
jgi:hypothetical protein